MSKLKHAWYHCATCGRTAMLRREVVTEEPVWCELLAACAGYMRFVRWATTTESRCPGSGKPARTDGSCDRCAVKDVVAEYRETDIAAHLDECLSGERFTVAPALTYGVARDHDAIDGRKS